MRVRLLPSAEQVVVVVGASSGIGRETALRFAARGAKVVAAARSEPGLDSLVAEISAAGGQAIAVDTDVTDYAQVEALAQRALDSYGRIDSWVHVAGVALYATVEQTTPDEFRRVVDTNLLGPVYGTMAALPHLKARGGALIVVSSIEAKRAFPFHGAYAATKHGVDGFLEALRLELRREEAPVSVTQVLPAAINTPLFSQARTKLGVKPMGVPPIYQPSVVVDAILYAAEHPVRDLVAGGAGVGLLAAQRLSPRLTDAALLRFGFRSQQTDEPKSPDAPHNLYDPVPTENRVEGDFSDEAQPRSFITWLATHPGGRRGAFAAAALGATVLATRRARRPA